MSAVLVAVLTSVAVVVVLPPNHAWRPGHELEPAPPRPAVSAAAGDWLGRYRALWSALAGLGVACFLGGVVGLVLGAAAAAVAWVMIGRAEPASERRRREAVEREIPGVVHLLATALSSGCGTAEALRLVCEALPGPAADLVAQVPTRLSLGAEPEQAWESALLVESLAPLARTMIRAQRSGSPVADAVERLSGELAEATRLRVEERARAVGVKAAVPLGLCLLPSFVLLGIVPLVVGLLQSLAL